MTIRRKFLSRYLGWFGAAAAAPAMQPPPPSAPVLSTGGLGRLFLPRPGRRRRTSSWNPTGRNADRVAIAAGAAHSLADLKGAGCIRHIWLTVRSEEPDCLRRLVLRASWDGEPAPSVESPVGDFFGVGHARVAHYWSLPLNMVTGGSVQASGRAAMNCFFPMPFARSASLSIENQGAQPAGIYYYVDYEEYERLPAEALRFHAQWRRENPARPGLDIRDRTYTSARVSSVPNLNGAGNYLILDARGRGQYVGCVLSIDHINPIPDFSWFGEGDDMVFIDGGSEPSLRGTGTEDYFCAAFGYPAGQNSMPYHGISLAGPTEGPQAYSGKWSMYRFHVEDPIQFSRSIRFTIEHGHANAHADDYSSVAYWYQTEPHASFPELLPVDKRLPLPDHESLRRFWQTR